jgi:hypothetical protein
MRSSIPAIRHVWLHDELLNGTPTSQTARLCSRRRYVWKDTVDTWDWDSCRLPHQRLLEFHNPFQTWGPSSEEPR